MESEAPVALSDERRGGRNWENYLCASPGIKETRALPNAGIGFKKKPERHLRNADRSKKKRDNPTISAGGAMAEHGGHPKRALALVILILGWGNVVSPTPQHQPPMIPSQKINTDYAPPPLYSPQSPIFPPKAQYPPPLLPTSASLDTPPSPRPLSPASAILDPPPSPSEDDQSPDLATQPTPAPRVKTIVGRHQ